MYYICLSYVYIWCNMGICINMCVLCLLMYRTKKGSNRRQRESWHACARSPVKDACADCIETRRTAQVELSRGLNVSLSSSDVELVEGWDAPQLKRVASPCHFYVHLAERQAKESSGGGGVSWGISDAASRFRTLLKPFVTGLYSKFCF